MLTSNAIQFLASVADRQQYKALFEDPNTLASICEKIIVPNIEMREVDVELFEDNPEEYIRRDLVRIQAFEGLKSQIYKIEIIIDCYNHIY
jgi:exportin-2 (importin alpha re-exporter)